MNIISHEVLQIDSNKYSIIMKTTLKYRSTTSRACLLAINIFDDEMVKIVLYMTSNMVNYKCILIFVTTSRVLN